MGAVLKHIEYYPFGTKRSDTGSFNDLKHNFTGQYEDDESELLYYKQRYYDPQLGRFISADPLYLEEIDERGVNSQELNLYAYVGNNPLNRVDPDGNIVYVIQHGAVVMGNPLKHTAVALRPDTPSIFSNNSLFSKTKGVEATLGGQPWGDGASLSRPFGNLHSSPNFSMDSPSNMDGYAIVETPFGKTIASLFKI